MRVCPCERVSMRQCICARGVRAGVCLCKGVSMRGCVHARVCPCEGVSMRGGVCVGGVWPNVNTLEVAVGCHLAVPGGMYAPCMLVGRVTSAMQPKWVDVLGGSTPTFVLSHQITLPPPQVWSPRCPS